MSKPNDSAPIHSAPIHGAPSDSTRYAQLAGFGGDWRERWWHRDFLALVARRWELNQLRNVLDVGCGAGHWLRTLAPHLNPSAKFHGIDRERSFIEMAAQHTKATFTLGRAEALPFEEGTFDLVTCQTLLIHVADVEAVIQEMSRVLKPGGRLLVAEPDNFATAASMLNTSVQVDPLPLLAFQQVCHAGKRGLGEGDETIGGRLPAIVATAGMSQVEVYNTDKCTSLTPPYATRSERVELANHMECSRQQVWLTGTREESLRWFLAGGGNAAEFDGYWRQVMSWWQEFSSQAARGTFGASRGVLHYLISATKPLSPTTRYHDR